jgi:outer membrane protein TolC
MLPLLALEYTSSVNGLGKSVDESVEMLSRKRFEDHRIGLRMEVPIGNEAARSRLRRALASRLQQLQTKEQRAAQIQQEVLNAADQLEANWQRILAAQKRVVLAARVLEAETRQFTLGLRTSTDVLNAQANLANAQSAEITALTEYQIAQIDIAFATGTLLGASHVGWEPAPQPRK